MENSKKIGESRSKSYGMAANGQRIQKETISEVTVMGRSLHHDLKNIQ